MSRMSPLVRDPRSYKLFALAAVSGPADADRLASAAADPPAAAVFEAATAAGDLDELAGLMGLLGETRRDASTK